MDGQGVFEFILPLHPDMKEGEFKGV